MKEEIITIVFLLNLIASCFFGGFFIAKLKEQTKSIKLLRRLEERMDRISNHQLKKINDEKEQK